MMAASGITDSQGRPLGSLRTMDTRRFRLKAFSNEVKLYERYFHKRIAKEVSYAQVGFAVIILTLQLMIMGLLFGPAEISNVGVKTSGIWPSIITSFAAGVTLWATKKPTYCKLHSAMAFHIVAAVAHIYLEYFIMEVTIPTLQWRISYLYRDPSVIDGGNGSPFVSFYRTTTISNQYQENESELNRTVACLVFTVVIALSGIFQVLMAFFMALKTGRAICSGRTQLEGRCLQVEAVNPAIGAGIQEASREDSHDKESEDDVFPKLERSDTLPPPPYESGYFNQSLTA